MHVVALGEGTVFTMKSLLPKGGLLAGTHLPAETLGVHVSAYLEHKTTEGTSLFSQGRVKFYRSFNILTDMSGHRLQP